MKRLLFAILAVAAITFTGCNNDKEETSYTVRCSMTIDSSSPTINFMIHEYNKSGEIIGNKSMKNLSTGSNKKFVANSQAEKVKLLVEMTNGTASLQRWIQQVYYLKKGSNINITIKDDTIIGQYEP